MFTTLIVDDNPLFSDALGAALRSRFPFLAIANAFSARGALAQIDAAQPGLIFMDVTLPDGSGLALTQRLRKDGVAAVIVVLTSHDPAEYRDLAIRSGADHFMGKGSIDLVSRIFGLVESLVASRFRALIVTDDAVFNDQMNAFVSQIRPGSVVVDTTEWDAALELGDTLKPNLLVLKSNSDQDCLSGLCDALRERCASEDMAVVRVGEIGPERQWADTPNYCVTRQAAFGAEMTTIIDSLAGAHPHDMRS